MCMVINGDETTAIVYDTSRAVFTYVVRRVYGHIDQYIPYAKEYRVSTYACML